MKGFALAPTLERENVHSIHFTFSQLGVVCACMMRGAGHFSKYILSGFINSS